MKLFPISAVVQGQTIQLIARAEGDGGIVGDCIVNLAPGDDVWGVTYDAAVQQIQTTGVVIIPESAPAQ
jgi:hypothetical protein